MNDVQCLIDRQLGIVSRLHYDNVFKRLVVDSEESFYGLQNADSAANFDQDPPIFACRFSEAPGYENILALANEDGKVAIQDTTTKKTASKLEVFQCHNNAVFDLAWMPHHMKFVTVSGDHTACLWDVGSGAPRRVSVFAGHTRSVKCVAFAAEEAGVFATGARDGHALVWDTRLRPLPALLLRPDARLSGCHSPRTPRARSARPAPAPHAPRALSVTGLAFRDRRTLATCGECDGGIKLWDLRRHYDAAREPLPRHSIPYCGSSARSGYTNLVVDPAGVRLYASCMDDVVYCFNVAACGARPEQRYAGHQNGSFYIKASLSPDGAYLASGSGDKHAYVWSVRHPEPLVRLAGHRAEVTCAAWRPRGDLALVTCSDDARHKIWRVGREFPDPDRETRGRAEPAPRTDAASLPKWGALERTPDSRKRRAAAQATSHRAKRLQTPTSARPTKTKRCLADLMSASRDTDEAERQIKRLKLDSPSSSDVPPGSKRPGDAEESPSKRRAVASDDWCYLPVAGSSFMTPTKKYEPKPLSPTTAHNRSPANVSPGRVTVVTFSTPTKNLPNFVIDGEAPHQRLMSPVRKKDPATDWLTALAREKKGKTCEFVEKTSSIAPNSPKENIPTRRNSVSEKCQKSAKKSRTLLKYFNVKVKDCN